MLARVSHYALSPRYQHMEPHGRTLSARCNHEEIIASLPLFHFCFYVDDRRSLSFLRQFSLAT